MNRRITIQRRGSDLDGWNQPQPDSWSDVATLWASIRTMNGREFAAADRDASSVTASIRLRYRTDLTAGMRVLHGSTIYNVTAVLPDELRREHVDLACTTGMGQR
uniref:phage head closure protein n=1 Tax=Pigmentiphaga litoralis TaxID=516702 RepID=UPI0027E55847|nr:phage head closure protein [Pigmentiphaga litoralis]